MIEDLRDFIDEMDKRGQLKKVDGADCETEIGAITEVVADRDGPALLFDNIKDYPKGYRVLSYACSEIGQRIGFGLDEKQSPFEIVRKWKDQWNEFKPLPPVEVQSGPVMENVLTGDDVNILKFPAPKWHEKDGGRYIGTGVVTITKDPDEGWINVGTYRVMVHDEKTVGFYISPGKHGRVMREKYWDRGESCPVVMCFGEEILLFGLSTLRLPWGWSELDVAGHMRGKPIEIIRGEVTGLPIPAKAEIVIEGFAPPPSVEVRHEGPFGEWTGYYASGSRPEPVVHVKAIYHRDNPILLGQPPIKNRDTFPIPLQSAATLWNKLESAGMTGIKGVYFHGAGGRPLGVVSIKQQYLGHAKEVAHASASLFTGGALAGKWIIVVDDDIDPSNLEDVLWAVYTRCDPEMSIDIVRGFLTSPLDPSLRPEKRNSGDITTAKIIMNACRPYHWKNEFPQVSRCSDDLRKKVSEKFGL